jgi:serine/threonine protein phosphatase PrpC
MNKNLIIQEEDLHDRLEYKNGHLHFLAHSSVRDKLNQDCLGIYDKDGFCTVLVVSDGMGGHSGGEKASRIICETISDYMNSHSKDESLREMLLNAIEESDIKVKELKIGAGATLTAVIIHKGKAQFFNIGDSASFLIGSRGKIKYKTIEHSPLGYGIESGLIPHENSEEAELVEGNIVSNGIGFETVRIELSQKIDLNDGDIIALMSDGVSEHFVTDQISELASTGLFEERLSGYLSLAEKDPESYFADDNSLILFKFIES